MKLTISHTFLRVPNRTDWHQMLAYIGIGVGPFKCVVAPSGMPINNKLSLIDLHLRSIMSSRNSALSSFNFVCIVLRVLRIHRNHLWHHLCHCHRHRHNSSAFRSNENVRKATPN